MKNSSLKELLQIYIFGKITPEDFHKLKESTLHARKDELNDNIKSIWDEIDDVAPMNKTIKAEVLTDIHKQIDVRTTHTSFLWIKIAAVLLPVFLSLGSYFYFSNKYHTAPEEFIVMAESGQKTKILLPDSTYVWLNSDSKLSYSSDFNQNNRVVKLEGEAFFEVSSNTGTRFIVEAENIQVAVLGTAFNVSAYREDATIDISLLRGKVVLENKLDNTTLTAMYPNQAVSVLKENMKWEIHTCDAEIERLWTQNKLKFENAPAAEVFRKLERWYGVKIYVENMNEDIFYGFTLKSESLREILYEMDKITPIVYKVNGEEVNIKYR